MEKLTENCKMRSRRFLNSIFKYFGYELVSSSLVSDWQRYPKTQPSYQESGLPEGAKKYLRPDNPRLRELEKRYAEFDKDVCVPLLWKNGHVRPEDLLYFRGDNAYVWQLRGQNTQMMHYALSTYYIKSIDRLGLLEKLKEDGGFGCYTFFIDQKKISRDLLDSINEIYFLDKHLHISGWKGVTVLDIGAGYGRLAHRMVEALPNVKSCLCTDAVAVSTFISEYYLRFRDLEDRAAVVPLDEIEAALENTRFDIAVNIYSFSECSIPAIEWWLSLLRKSRIKYLMIVPNPVDRSRKRLLTDDRRDIGKILKKHGFKQVVKEPKYKDEIVQEYGVCPTYYYLYALSARQEA